MICSPPGTVPKAHKYSWTPLCSSTIHQLAESSARLLEMKAGVLWLLSNGILSVAVRKEQFVTLVRSICRALGTSHTRKANHEILSNRQETAGLTVISCRSLTIVRSIFLFRPLTMLD